MTAVRFAHISTVLEQNAAPGQLLQVLLDFAGGFHQFRLVAGQRNDRHFDGRKVRTQFQNNALVAVLEGFFGKRLAQHRQNRTVHARRRLNHIGNDVFVAFPV